MRLHSSSCVVKTPGAPPQCFWCQVWSAGCVLHVLLSGQIPIIHDGDKGTEAAECGGSKDCIGWMEKMKQNSTDTVCWWFLLGQTHFPNAPRKTWFVWDENLSFMVCGATVSTYQVSNKLWNLYKQLTNMIPISQTNQPNPTQPNSTQPTTNPTQPNPTIPNQSYNHQQPIPLPSTPFAPPAQTAFVVLFFPAFGGALCGAAAWDAAETRHCSGLV